MRFALDITLGNEAMQTLGDVAALLRRLADELDRWDDGAPLDPSDAVSTGVRDDNGNSVGRWKVAA